MAAQQQLHARIYGHVQGVSFRYNALREAQRLKLMGWVRNLPDGSVETLAAGTQIALDEFLAWLRRGPSGATVSRVDVSWTEPEQSFTGFEILHGTD